MGGTEQTEREIQRARSCLGEGEGTLTRIIIMMGHTFVLSVVGGSTSY